ncbi:MAG: NADH-quinone oxidoreductase subunit L [Candidatus Omnitrophica bacterium]|nr:NADH-quinone oxidoreductase subunit L [Candidatus Omnitrophota bacterium]
MDASLFRIDSLSIFMGIFIGLFTLLTIIYSFGYMKGRKGLLRYYSYIILTLIASLGAVFSNNLILFIVFWGFLGMLLYLLIQFGWKETTSYTAKKALIIIGGTDAFMLLGLALIWHLTGSLQMDQVSIGLTSKVAVIAYLCLASGAFAKAGAMPFHTWVPDTAEDAPASIAAFLPASLDKLLGIYFLARLSLEVFRMTPGINVFLMVIGSVTIVAAVMMALIQHDLKRLLGYHAVSQVGYMVLGIGTGNPIGIAGGVFHMLNHSIYKSCLFFSGGAVEKKTGTTNLDKLGGLAKIMPITFITFLIAAFSISGVPPFNGFASKWMVYQGIIKTATNGSGLWIIWLVAAMFGSALTLASFMKLVHAVFLGQPSEEVKKKKQGEVGPSMWIPTVILAALCVIFGVFAYRVPLKMFIFPSLGGVPEFTGIWDPGLATALIVLGIVIGFVIYLMGTALKTRTTETFVLGEFIEDHPDMRLSGTDFYNTIKEIGILKVIYRLAEKKVFDIYEVGAKATLGFNGLLRYMHNGILLTYLAWCLFGTGILFWVLLR